MGGCKVNRIKINLGFDADAEISREQQLLQCTNPSSSRLSNSSHEFMIPSFHLNILRRSYRVQREHSPQVKGGEMCGGGDRGL
ncbi:uncharacterized protein STEHIDRAFT_126438 [Stereum hirsutum FP-91666 SS1]|uniref:Uncharacterized protein n=1 Tax=Stereum hirsutum (strain FP-91666) TaxID=721885 RepID=R7RW74_STEHR|nr:uncharacterized protein STEHIDRAFT_126438 [Stereum hirsutum FP-91666 SS1]EIM79561.1 hypothetical protein STEHIDRAFT_126438 [Stereum hirsutum FP-91666 SS1]